MTIRSPQETAGLLSRLWARIRLAWRLLVDSRVPIWPKLVIPGLALAYLIIPLDLITDYIPVLGQVDDLMLIALGLQAFIMVCPKGLAQEHIGRIWGQATQQPATTQDQTAPAGQQKPPQGDVVEGEYTVKNE